jgi:hypothetical protein
VSRDVGTSIPNLAAARQTCRADLREAHLHLSTSLKGSVAGKCREYRNRQGLSALFTAPSNRHPFAHTAHKTRST